MKTKKRPQQLIQAGEIYIKENHVRRIVRLCQLSYGNIAFIPKPLIVEGQISPEISEAFFECIHDHLDSILWEYEGQYLYERALRLVSIRPRSFKEFHDFFAKNSDNSKTISLCETRIQPFVDDEAFAEYLVQKERGHNPKGDTVIRQKLLVKGIDKNIIEKALRTENHEVDNLIEKQFNKVKNRIYQKALKKDGSKDKLFIGYMKQYLFSKGFSIEEINNYLKDKNEMGFSEGRY